MQHESVHCDGRYASEAQTRQGDGALLGNGGFVVMRVSTWWTGENWPVEKHALAEAYQKIECMEQEGWTVTHVDVSRRLRDLGDNRMGICTRACVGFERCEGEVC